MPRPNGHWYDYVVVGGGAAGTAAALRLAAVTERAVGLVTEEARLPYSRVRLPGIVRGELRDQEVTLHPPQHYESSGVAVLAGNAAIAVDADNRRVLLADGGTIGYGDLLVASGGSPCVLDVAGEDLAGVHRLRTLDDAVALRDSLGRAQRVVVAGGGYIALEVVAAAVQRGCSVTVLLRDAALLDHVLPSQLSSAVSAHVAGFANVVPHDVVDRFVGDAASRLRAVATEGGRVVAADTACVGVGIEPNTDWLRGSGVELGDGVVCNEYLETSAPHVYAAGDVARYYDPVAGCYRRLGNWTSASHQGYCVAATMAGERTIADPSNAYSITVLGLQIAVLGNAKGGETISLMGSREEGVLVAAARLNGRLVGAACLAWVRDARSARARQCLAKALHGSVASATQALHDVAGIVASGSRTSQAEEEVSQS